MTHYMVNRGMNRVPLCEDCDEQSARHNANFDAPFPIADEWLCDNCAERRWDRDQERRMEEG